MVLLCQEMNIEVLAEGVETDEQLSLLQGYGYQHFQGYKFHKPLLPDIVLQYLTTHGQTMRAEFVNRDVSVAMSF